MLRLLTLLEEAIQWFKAIAVTVIGFSLAVFHGHDNVTGTEGMPMEIFWSVNVVLYKDFVQRIVTFGYRRRINLVISPLRNAELTGDIVTETTSSLADRISA